MREFNATSVCVPNMHYMVDLTDKIDEIKKLIENGIIVFTLSEELKTTPEERDKV